MKDLMKMERIIHRNEEYSDMRLVRKELALEYCSISTYADIINAYFHFVLGDIAPAIQSVVESVLEQQIYIFLKVL